MFGLEARSSNTSSNERSYFRKEGFHLFHVLLKRQATFFQVCSEILHVNYNTLYMCVWVDPHMHNIMYLHDKHTSLTWNCVRIWRRGYFFQVAENGFLHARIAI